MALIIGIDEAGYGPILGPLVVATSVWRCPDEHVDLNWWRVFKHVICVNRPKRADWRLHINDSKQVYLRAKGLTTLARPVLAMLRTCDCHPRTIADVLAWLGAHPEAVHDIPWYQHLDRPLRPENVTGVAAKVRTRFESSGVRLEQLFAEVVPAKTFNLRFGRTRNKANVLVERILRLIERSTQLAAPQENVYIRIDRLGGRADYTNLLLQAFPGADLTIDCVDQLNSRYSLRNGAGRWCIEFLVDGDARHLPIALASMTAKYVRELIMEQFNAYWHTRMPALRPTAGYFKDAHRFLEDIDPLLPTAPFERADLIRAR